jgi:hypothetical protein
LTTRCVETTYVPYKDGKDEGETLPFAPRKVAFEIGRDFYVDMQNSVCVMSPVARENQRHYARLVEGELTRSLRGKINRVVGSTERRVAARNLALTGDLNSPENRQLLSRHLDCDAIVLSEIAGGPTNLLVWSQISMTVDVRMERASDGKLLWRAKNETSRSDGGWPLTPLSIVTNGFAAARFSADEANVTASLIADAVRKMVDKTLPDVRRFHTARRPRPCRHPVQDEPDMDARDHKIGSSAGKENFGHGPGV